MHRSNRLEASRGADDGWSDTPTRTWPEATATIGRMSVPAALTFVLTAVEGAVVYGLLRTFPESTVAIASFAVYERLVMIALMPAIGASVAVLPYVARNLAEHRAAEVSANLRRTIAYATVLALAFAIPSGVVFPVEIGAYFVGDGEELSEQAITLLRLTPLATVAVLPFLILRPVFEAVQRPRIGIAVSILRFAILSIPMLLAGAHFAADFGVERLTGLVIGTIAAAVLASAVTAALCVRLARAAGQ
jgi:Na+-driven multidrug efflux pump